MSFVKDNDVYKTVKSFFYVHRIGKHDKQKNSKFGVGAISSETYNFKLNGYQSQISEKKEAYVLAGIMLLHLLRICLHLQQKCKIFIFFCFLVLGTYTMLFAFPRTIIFPAFIVCFQGTLRNDVSRLHLEELRKSLDTSCPFLGTRCNLVYQLFIFTHSQ